MLPQRDGLYILGCYERTRSSPEALAIYVGLNIYLSNNRVRPLPGR